MSRLRARLRARDGRPAQHASVVIFAYGRITEASRGGVGLYLSAEEVRALDWAVVRVEGGIETDIWRDEPCGAGNPND